MAEGDDRPGEKPSAAGGAERRPVTIDLSAKEVGEKGKPPAESAPEPAPTQPDAKKSATQPSADNAPKADQSDPSIPSAFAPGASKPEASQPAARIRSGAPTMAGFFLAAIVGGAVAVGALWLLGQQGMTPFASTDEATRSALDETRQAVTALESEIGNTPRDVGAFRDQLGSLQSAVEGLRAESTGRADALDAITALQARIDALESPPAGAGSNAGADLAGRVEALAKEVETLTASPQQAASPDVAPRLDELADRLAALEARPAPDLGALETRIGDAASRIDAVEDGLDAVSRDLEAVKTDLAAGLDAVKANVERFATATSRIDALSLRAAVADTSAALDAGRPFAAELAVLSALGVDPASVDTLRPYAESGIPDAPALAAVFDEALAALPANAPPPPTAGAVDRLFSSARSLVSVRRSGAPPDSAETAAKVRSRLAAEDFSGALEAWRSLPPAAQEETGSFADALQARLDAESALAALQNRALMALSGQSG